MFTHTSDLTLLSVSLYKITTQQPSERYSGSDCVHVELLLWAVNRIQIVQSSDEKDIDIYRHRYLMGGKKILVYICSRQQKLVILKVRSWDPQGCLRYSMGSPAKEIFFIVTISNTMTHFWSWVSYSHCHKPLKAKILSDGEHLGKMLSSGGGGGVV